jgi:hypothetical protein
LAQLVAIRNIAAPHEYAFESIVAEERLLVAPGHGGTRYENEGGYRM